MKLSSFSLNDPFTVKVLIEQNRPLVFVKNLLVLLVLILFLSHLIPIVLPHPIYLSSVIEVEAMLEAGAQRDDPLIAECLHHGRLLPMYVISGTELSLCHLIVSNLQHNCLPKSRHVPARRRHSGSHSLGRQPEALPLGSLDRLRARVYHS